MADAGSPLDLTDHFLIAMPSLDDATFARSVVYLCEHTGKGALGLVINRPSDISLQHLFDKVDLPLGRAELGALPVLQGGPVQNERGFVLHDAMAGSPVGEDGPNELAYASTLAIAGGLEMTTSKDILEALSEGVGPRRLLVTLGYSSWGEGQLESELAENAWLTVRADQDILFNTPLLDRYDRAMALLGLPSWTVLGGAGHA